MLGSRLQFSLFYDKESFQLSQWYANYECCIAVFYKPPKKTPAQKLGITPKAYKVSDILNFSSVENVLNPRLSESQPVMSQSGTATRIKQSIE